MTLSIKVHGDRIRGESVRHSERVACFDIKADHDSGGLRRDRRAVNAVAGNGVAASATVIHRERSKGRWGSAVRTIEQRNVCHSVWILNAGGNNDSIAGLRKNG